MQACACYPLFCHWAPTENRLVPSSFHLILLISFCLHHPQTKLIVSLKPFCSLRSKLQLANCPNSDVKQNHPVLHMKHSYFKFWCGSQDSLLLINWLFLYSRLFTGSMKQSQSNFSVTTPHKLCLPMESATEKIALLNI